MCSSIYNNICLPSHKKLNEPLLTFSPENEESLDIHPLKGLTNYGPYNQTLINNSFKTIRIATIGPEGAKQAIKGLLDEINRNHQPRERRQYLVEFPGFFNVFGTSISIAQKAHIKITPETEKTILNSDKPYKELSQMFVRALSTLSSYRNDFDVLYIYLPEHWQDCFEYKVDNDFDLHDYIKAIAVGYGIPTQIIREDKALNYPCRCSVMWRLSIATYCKVGGVPWKLADTLPGTAYIGLGYAIRGYKADNKPRFVTCCSQVFDEDGSGLEFVAYETDDFALSGKDNPYLTRTGMQRIMWRCLSIYMKRNAGKSPKNIVIHKSTDFKPEEIQGCYDALRVADNIELVQIQQDVSWRGIKLEKNKYENPKSYPAGYPCDRGTYAHLDGNSVLLWTQGNILLGKNYFQEGKGIPSPILLRRFAGHGDWYDSCKSVLGLSKMNWNSDSLYSRLPVTLEFAKILATTIKRIEKLDSNPYQYRYFM